MKKKLYFYLRRIAYLCLGSLSRMFLSRKSEGFILCYHSVNSDDWLYGVSAEKFKQQIDYLSMRYHFVTLNEISEYINGHKSLPSPYVAITFDDGYKDVSQVKDYIKMKGIKPTMFVIADAKHANRGELETDRAFLNKKEILDLVKNGWEIGCHTDTHADMYKLDKNEVTREIFESRGKLEGKLGVSVKYIAYPKGRYTKNILLAAQKARYDLGLTIKDGVINHRTNKLLVPRIGIDRSHTFAEFKVIGTPLVCKFRILMRSLGFGF